MIRNLEQRLERLEHAMLPSNDSAPVIYLIYVPHGTLKGFKNDHGSYCAHLPGESEEALEARACELVRKHGPSTPGPHCAIPLYMDCEETTQKDWEEQAPAVA